MLKYIIAAATGFFSCPIICASRGIINYEWTWVDFFLAGLYMLIMWSWGGDNGVYEQLKDYARRAKKNVHR